MTVDPGITPDDENPDGHTPAAEEPAEGPVEPDGPTPDQDDGVADA